MEYAAGTVRLHLPPFNLTIPSKQLKEQIPKLLESAPSNLDTALKLETQHPLHGAIRSKSARCAKTSPICYRICRITRN